MLPSIFGENLFDDFFGDSFGKDASAAATRCTANTART